MNLNHYLRCVALLPLMLTVGCGEEAEPGPEPPVEILPEAPVPTYTAGHLTVAQRGVALDRDDLPVIPQVASNVGLPAPRIESDFGLLVLNRPYTDWRASVCPRSNEADDYLPRATSEQFIGELAAQTGLSFDRIAVNVDLLSPARRSLLYICFDRGAAAARFDVVEHREKIIAAFVDLARVDKVRYITVGLEMNRYYHLNDGEFRDDYANWITLYREVYDAIKAEDSSIQVGPGISWSVLMRRTVPEIAAELALENEEGEEVDDLVAVYRAFQRTVEPMLNQGRGSERRATADYVAITAMPFGSEPPFLGDPAPESEDGMQGILDYYLLMPIVANGLPVVLPQIDWITESSSTAALKSPFLETLKRAVSHVDIEWVAWRRTADLPRQPAEANPCVRYTGSAEPTLAYSIDYCSGGMIAPSGQPRDQLDILTTDP